MIGWIRVAYWLWILWRIASSSSASQVWETLSPSFSARRCNSALREGLTHAAICTVCRFLEWFGEGGEWVSVGCVRAFFLAVTGCDTAARTGGGAGLSCHTPPSGCGTL